mgnify:CR=1 FL=1
MTKVENIKKIALQYENLMLNNTGPSSVDVLQPKKLYKLNIDQSNPRENARHRVGHIISFDPTSETPIKPIPHFPTIETEITNEKYSPSMKYRAVFRKKEDKRILEIWSATNLRQSLKVSDFHEDLYSDSTVTQSEIIWSADETRLLYVAEKKADKKVTAFDEIKENETDKYMNSAKFKQDMGEKFNKKFQPEVYVYKLEENELYRVVNLPEKVIPAFINFADTKGNSIVMTGFEKPDEFFMGLCYCFNKPSDIYFLREIVLEKVKDTPKGPLKSADAQEELALKIKKEASIKENQAVRMTNDAFAIVPILSPDRKKVIYLYGDHQNIHAFTLGLKKFTLELPQDNSAVLRPVAEFNENFNGITGHHELFRNIGWLSDSQHFVFNSYMRGDTGIYVVNTETNEMKRLDQPAYASEDWYLLKIDNDQIIASVSNLIGKPRLAIYSGFDLTGKTIEEVVKGTWHYYDLAKLSPKPLKSENTVKLEDRGKFNEEVLTANGIEAFFWSIKDFKDSKGNVIPDSEKPLVLLLHGGPHFAITGGYNHYMHYLLYRGYNILAPNFSGSTGYGQKHITRLLTKIGEVDKDEVLAVLDLALERKLGNPKKLCVAGGSYGGFLGHVLMNEKPDLFRVALIRNPAINLLHLMYTSDIPEWVFAEVLDRGYQTEVSVQQLIKVWEASPTTKINSEIRTRIQIQLGGNDRRVPPEGALDYYRRLKKHGVQVECNYYPNEGHALTSSMDTEFDAALKRLLFLEEHLPTGYSEN